MTVSKFSQLVIAVAAAGALLVSVYNSAQIKEVKAGVGDVHILMNSRLTELLELTRSSSKAEGVKQEKARQQAEDK